MGKTITPAPLRGIERAGLLRWGVGQEQAGSKRDWFGSMVSLLGFCGGFPLTACLCCLSMVLAHASFLTSLAIGRQKRIYKENRRLGRLKDDRD